MQMTLALVESAINRFLAMDLEAAELIAPLEGKLIGILPRAVDEPICCLISGARIEVITQPQRTPDLVVAGNLLDLVRLGAVGSPESLMRERDITMSGDVEVARSVKMMLRRFQPDWEESLSRMVGDVLARRIAVGIRSIAEWTNESRESLTATLSEALTEEKRVLPTRLRYQQHQAAVEQVRDDSDRLMVRVDQLLSRSVKAGEQ